MWICFNDAFISAVQDKNDPDDLCVRARNRSHLETLFPDKEVIVYAGTDYACRVYITKGEFVDLVCRRIHEIDYRNFKKSVRDHMLHQLYGDFWGLHYAYQERLGDRSRFAWGAHDIEMDD